MSVGGVTSPARTRFVHAIAVVALLAYGWWFTDLQPFTAGSLFAMFGAAAMLLALATTRPRAVAGARGSAATIAAAPGFVVAVVMWVSVVAAATAWELIAFVNRPRSQHPTMSSLLDSIEVHHPLRFVVFVLWLALGWAIAS